MRSAADSGFTLIELIVVIVILGILAAVAVPKFVNFRDDAEKAVIEGFVASLPAARTMWLGKVILCGSDYPSSSNVRLADFIGLKGPQPAAACTYETEQATSGYFIQGKTIEFQPVRDGIMADPDAEILFLGSDASYDGTRIEFLTKTGRTIEIHYDNSAGNISWTAIPAY